MTERTSKRQWATERSSDWMKRKANNWHVLFYGCSGDLVDWEWNIVVVRVLLLNIAGLCVSFNQVGSASIPKVFQWFLFVWLMALLWNDALKTFVVYASNVNLQSCKLYYIESCQNYFSFVCLILKTPLQHYFMCQSIWSELEMSDLTGSNVIQ